MAGSEAALADAFREIERKVSDARAAALVLETLMENTLAERPQHDPKSFSSLKTKRRGCSLRRSTSATSCEPCTTNTDPGLPQPRVGRERWPEAARTAFSHGEWQIPNPQDQRTRKLNKGSDEHPHRVYKQKK